MNKISFSLNISSANVTKFTKLTFSYEFGHIYRKNH